MTVYRRIDVMQVGEPQSCFLEPCSYLQESKSGGRFTSCMEEKLGCRCYPSLRCREDHYIPPLRRQCPQGLRSPIHSYRRMFEQYPVISRGYPCAEMALHYIRWK